MKRKVYRGEMYFADLDPVVGSEQGGCRPVLIFQNNIGNLYSPTVIVAALSGQVKKENMPTHCLVQAHAGLEEESQILLEQIRTIDKKRLLNYIGELDDKDMEQVDHCLAISLDLKVA